MAGHGKIDILIMREETGVRQYRLSPGVLKALLYFPLVLLALAAGAVAVAMHLHAGSAAIAEKDKAMRAELDTAGERLLRLENLEKVLRSKDVTELETLLGSYNPDAPAWWKPREERKEPGKDADPKERDCPKTDLARVLGRVDAGVAGVDNFRSKIENKKLLVNFDLSNVSPQTALSGKAEVALLTNEGALLPLKAEKDELSFQIQRFKQVAASLAMPQKVETKDLYAVKMTLSDPSGKHIFSQIYPMPKE